MIDKISDDEWRLLRFFRLLSPVERFEVMGYIGETAMERCTPDRTICDVMPEPAGVEPEGVEYIHNTSSISHVIYSGIEETGFPQEFLLGTSDLDECEAIPRFIHGAEKAALNQGNSFTYDEDFAREYLNAWRWGIVLVCEQNRNTNSV